MIKKSLRVATGIYRQGQGSFSIRVSLGERGKASYKYYTETWRGSVEGAKKRRAEIVTDTEKGTFKPPERKTFGEYWEAWFRYNQTRVAMEKIVDRTAALYEETIRRHFEHLWPRPLAKISTQDIADVYSKLKTKKLAKKKQQGCSIDYILSVHRAFKSGWNDCKALKIQVPDILDDLAELLPQKVKKEKIVLSPTQAQALLSSLRDPVAHGVVFTCLATMARINEVLGLRWQDVDVEKRIIAVIQQVVKTGRAPEFDYHKTYKTTGARYIYMIEDLAAILRARRKQVLQDRLAAGGLYEPWDLVWCSPIGHPICRRSFARWKFKPVLQELGLPPISLHYLRHSAATMLLSSNVPPQIVQQICGHTEIQTTVDIYGHLTVEAQREALDKHEAQLKRK